MSPHFSQGRPPMQTHPAESGVSPNSASSLARIFHQDAELWRRTGRDRLGSTGAANRSFYWQDGHARYGRPEPARIRVTPNPIWVQTKRPWIACTDAPASKRGWPGEISGLAQAVGCTSAGEFRTGISGMPVLPICPISASRSSRNCLARNTPSSRAPARNAS